MAKQRKHKCIIAGCEREEKARGLCGSCYRMAQARVIAEETTWDTLVRRGLAKDARTSPFTRAFSKSK